MSELPEPYIPPPPLYRVEVDAGDLVTRVAVYGEVDLSTVDPIDREIESATAQPDLSHLVVDLRGMTFMDSTGLRLLLSLLNRAKRNDYRLTVVRASQHVHRAIEIAGLAEIMDFVDEPPDATSQ
jgi:anti-sigma B factor antagonist